jgi:hypothetical protein
MAFLGKEVLTNVATEGLLRRLGNELIAGGFPAGTMGRGRVKKSSG